MSVTRVLTVSLVLAAVVFGVAFMAPDTVVVYAVRSYDVLLHAPEVLVARNDTAGAWVLTSPGGETLTFGGDTAAGSNELVVTFDARPFLAAGLDPSLLPEGARVEGDDASARVVMRYDKGTGSFSDGADSQPVQALQDLIRNHRMMLGYHAALGHFGLALGGGNMLEWAQDQHANDKDLVFVLNPQPFADAGVDVANVQGWVLADVPVMDAQGRKSTARKLLKFYNLV
ncbi:MAG: hypothetical protein NT102_02480 [Caldiserica bacterium]|nr:hypothetical protein [Caldisericota bacterium]